MDRNWIGKPKLYISNYYHHDGRTELGWFAVMPWGGAEFVGTVRRLALGELLKHWWKRYTRLLWCGVNPGLPRELPVPSAQSSRQVPTRVCQ